MTKEQIIQSIENLKTDPENIGFGTAERWKMYCEDRNFALDEAIYAVKKLAD